MQVIECRKTVQIGYAKRRMEDKMDILNKAKTGKKERPIKVVQFGERSEEHTSELQSR